MYKHGTKERDSLSGPQTDWMGSPFQTSTLIKEVLI